MIGTLYHRASGAVLGTVQGPEESLRDAYATATTGVYLGVLDRATQYVIDDDTVAAREEVLTVVAPATAAPGDTVTATGLLDPCWVWVDGVLREVTGGSASTVAREGAVLQLALAGRYVGPLVECRVVTENDAALFADPRWAALQAATPAQIDAWLAANVTTVASAREVLKLLLLAVRKLGA